MDISLFLFLSLSPFLQAEMRKGGRGEGKVKEEKARLDLLLATIYSIVAGFELIGKSDSSLHRRGTTRSLPTVGRIFIGRFAWHTDAFIFTVTLLLSFRLKLVST